MRKLDIDWLRAVVHAGALLPLALLIWDASQNHLSVNPIQDVTFRTGRTALVLLVLTLACTPLHTLFRLKSALTVRSALGLYAFMYAGLHLFTFAYLDYGLDLELIGQTIAEKRYVVVGFAAFLIMLPLALTSTKGWQKRLGRRWKRLHRLSYVAGVLALIHFVWLVKADLTEPARFGLLVALLLALRVPIVRRTISSARDRAMGSIRGAWERRQAGIHATNELNGA